MKRLIPVRSESATLSAGNQSDPAARRLLVVDDSKALRDAVQRLLADLRSWEICGEAATGGEAVTKALELQPDVILMDVGLPELDGLEATRRIRQKLDVEVLIFTQYDSQQALQEAVAAGARGYLAKSRAADLVEALEAVVRGQSYTGHQSQSAGATG